MLPTQLPVHQVLTDQSVDIALTMTAQMFGLPKATVTQIVQVSLPLIAQMTRSNPELLKRLHAVARTPIPEPIRDFYVRMAENTTVRQAAMDDYKATFGTMLDVVNRDAARLAGTTAGQAREVIAAALPAVSQVLRRFALADDQAAFERMLWRLAD